MSRFIPFPLRYDAMPIDISASFGNEKPAGKHGFLRRDGAHFAFEDGTPARFWGVNFNGGACFPEAWYAEKAASRLAMTGINIVRFHQLDAEWNTPNLFSFSKGERIGTSRRLHPESMKRLDYLIKCLKEQGIYVYLDMNTYRKFKSGDGVENAWGMDDAGKPYEHYNRRLIELQKEFMFQIWNHKNPYTGLMYKDDPVIVLSETVNESNLIHPAFPMTAEPYVSEFRKLYRAWLDKHQLIDDAERIDLNDNTNPTLHAFKIQVMTEFQQEIYDYMRKIGVKIPITGENMMTDLGIHRSNACMDYMDSHAYFGGPDWGEVKRTCHSVAPTQCPSFNMESLAGMRDLKRPFFVSEWDMPWPNEYRAESSILFAAIGGLQGWAGWCIHTYAYSARLYNVDVLGHEVSSPIGGRPYREGVFSTWNDPAKYGLFYHAALITRRGDIREADQAIELLAENLQAQGGPPALRTATELARTGVLFEGESPSAEAVVRQSDRIIPDTATEVTSCTGELYRSWAKNYGMIDAPRTKAIYGFLGKNGEIRADGLSVQAKTDYAVIALSSLTDEDISSSDNLLLTTVGRAQNTGMRYEDDQMYDPGHAPVLIEVIEAEVAIRTRRTDLICWAVNAEGYFVGKVPSQYEAGWLKLSLGQTMPSMYYLIQAE